MSSSQKKQTQTYRNTARLKITWRYIVISSLIVLFAGWIASAMIRTTVTDRDKWLEKANTELERRDTIMPPRGDILAADGSVLATNLNYYTMRIDFRADKFSETKFRQSLDSLCDTLAYYHPIRNVNEWREYFEKELKKDPEKRSRSFTLLKNLTYAQSEAVKKYPFFRRSKNANATGLTRETVMRRCYPYGDMARRSIGRVGENGRPREIHGVSGLEYALDSLLYGRPGLTKKTPLTHNIVDMTDVPAIPGYTLTTTIDIAMQDIAENALSEILEKYKAEWGTVILMEVATGDIKAISNLERDENGKYIEAMNRAVMRYEPGSVVKTVSMVVALEKGFVKNLDEVYAITPYVFGGGGAITDTHSPSVLPVRQFIEYSSNIGMTKLIAPHYRNNPNGFRADIEKLGFFEPFNTGIAGEVPPNYPYLDIKAGGLTSLGRQTYGYATQISPLYMCAFYNAVANDGKFVRPRLVSKITTEHGDSIIPVSYIREQMCSPENARIVREMLHRVIYGEGGTAKMLRSEIVDIAGKTGTSKIALEMSQEDREKLKKNPKDSTVVRPRGYEPNAHRLAFCGFFPYDNPKYTCMVLVARPNVRSPQHTSGMVLYNIAHRMYSHGMLGGAPDYRTAASAGQTTPRLSATHDATRDSRLSAALGTSHAKSHRIPSSTAPGTIPDVSGLGLREAVYVLERAGYEVTFEGDGSVLAQSPAPGTAAKQGTHVKLKLEQR